METIKLRNKPDLQVNLNQSGFQLIDSSDPHKNGNYSFEHLEHVEFDPGGTDWFISLLSFIVDLPTGGLLSGGKYKNRPSIKLTIRGKTFKILLIDADLEKAKTVVQILNCRKPTHNNI